MASGLVYVRSANKSFSSALNSHALVQAISVLRFGGTAKVHCPLQSHFPSRHSGRINRVLIDVSRTDQRPVLPSIHHPCRSNSSDLPLGLLPSLELLQNADNLLQARKPCIELLVDTRLVVTKVLVEGSAVRSGAHGGGEDGLDHERVVGLEGVAVGGAEGFGELGSRVGEVGAEALSCKVEGSVRAMQLVYVFWWTGYVFRLT